MGADGNGNAPEPTLARTRESGFADRRGRLYRYLDARPWFRGLALALPVLAAAVALAPRLGSRAYPTEITLVGTPASENIKAPRELTVVDTQTTDRLREEAKTRVRRVYDLDVQLGARIRARIADAFASMESKRSPPQPDESAAAGTEPLADAEIERLLDEGRADFERLLGVSLSDREHAVLLSQRYAVELGAALGEVIARVESVPLIATRESLDEDRERGITIQRVPADGREDQAVDDVDSIRTESAARAQVSDAVRVALPELPAKTHAAVAGLLSRLVQPNLTLNRAATEKAREVAAGAVTPADIAIKKGEMILRDGERITERHLLIFAALNRTAGGTSTALVLLGSCALVVLLLLIAFRLRRGPTWSLDLGLRDMLFLATLFSLMVVAARLWLLVAVDVQSVLFSSIPLETFLFIIPVAAGAMTTRLVLRVETAILFAVVGSLMLGLMIDAERGYVVYALVGATLGATMIRTMSKRSDLLRAGLWVGVGQAAVAVGLQLFDAHTGSLVYAAAIAAGFASGLVAAVVALAMTSVVEAVFGYTTDLELLELANLNHPALKELIVQAPGSYHHSIIVGSLVEAAAEAIGANALLARVMAYYHDIGKGCNPSYFIENQRGGSNPHTKLKPSMSAMVVRRHVSDGLEIARRHRLGEQILAGIIEHHGTTLIQFFYQKAKEQEEESSPVSESDYRYPGRKPQSREAALVMLGDSVEAASRSLSDPTPARLQGLVTRVINLKFTDGQLDECDLTLKDLHSIAKSFTRIMNSIYHQRPEYRGVLDDISGKKPNGDSDSKSAKKTEGGDTPPEDDRPDNLRRLGIDGR